MFCPIPLAYIDPVSGTILLQVIIGGAIGAIALFRRSLWRISRLVFGTKQPVEEMPPTESSAPEGE